MFTPPYDPLATNFMTGGRMDYLPDAQYMTSPDYGAFRSVPSPSQLTDPMSRTSMYRDLTIANRGRLPFGIGGDYILDAYEPSVNQYRNRYQARSRMQDRMSAIGATAADATSSMGVAAGVTAALSLTPLAPIAWLGGAVAGGIAPTPASPYLDRIRQRRQIQNMTRSKVVAGADMNMVTGQGFSLEAASRLDNTTRTLASGDLLFKDEDYRKMMELGIQSGMMDYSSSASQYKDVLKKLRGNFKTMMEMYETADLGQIAQDMQRMQQMGAGMQDMRGVAFHESIGARVTGLSHNDLVSTYGQQGALTFSRLGLTNYQGSMTSIASAAQVTMAQRLGILAPDQIARAGGVSGIVQKQTEQQGKTLDNDALLMYVSDKDGNFDREKYDNIISGKTRITDVMLQGASKANNLEYMIKFKANKSKLQKEMMDTVKPAGIDLMRRQAALSLGKQLDSTLGTKDAMVAGLIAMEKLSGDEANLQATMWMDPKLIKASQDQLATQRHETLQNKQSEEAYSQSFLKKHQLALAKVYNSFETSTAGRYSTRSGIKNDREAAREAGIAMKYQAAFLTEKGANTLTPEAMDVLKEELKKTDYKASDFLDKGKRTEGKDAYKKMGSWVDRYMYNISDEDTNARHFELMDLTAKGADVSDKELAEMLKGTGITLTDKKLDDVAKVLDDKHDFTASKVRKTLSGLIGGTGKLFRGKTPEERAKNDKVIGAILASALKDGRDGGDLLRGMQGLMKQEWVDTRSSDYKKSDRISMDIEDVVGEMTVQKWAGIDTDEQKDILMAHYGKDTLAGTQFGLRTLVDAKKYYGKHWSKEQRAFADEKIKVFAKILGIKKDAGDITGEDVDKLKIMTGEDQVAQKKMSRALTRSLGSDEDTIGRMRHFVQATELSTRSIYEQKKLFQDGKFKTIRTTDDSSIAQVKDKELKLLLEQNAQTDKDLAVVLRQLTAVLQNLNRKQGM